MPVDFRLVDALPRLTDALTHSYSGCRRINHIGREPLPSRAAIVDVLNLLFELIYPGFYSRRDLHSGNISFCTGELLDHVGQLLHRQIGRALKHSINAEGAESRAGSATIGFLEKLPSLRDALDEDVLAALAGDPAAKEASEIVFCYPGLEAVTIYRIAHELHKLGIPLLPRMMTEYAHGKTGIDLHPGATIGRSFFIDHGTGVVIGETCLIGDRVKLYQGVTLGAVSLPREVDRDAAGRMVTHDPRLKKRHPTLEDGVIVYANATILGGNTVIGHGSVIGSNVWLTKSIPPDSVVVLNESEPSIRQKSAYTLDYQI